MILYTLRRKSKFLSKYVENELGYTDYTTDAIQFESMVDADKFVESNGLSNHEIVPVSISTGEYMHLIQYTDNGTRAYVKGEFYIHPNNDI